MGYEQSPLLKPESLKKSRTRTSKQLGDSGSKNSEDNLKVYGSQVSTKQTEVDPILKARQKGKVQIKVGGKSTQKKDV